MGLVWVAVLGPSVPQELVYLHNYRFHHFIVSSTTPVSALELLWVSSLPYKPYLSCQPKTGLFSLDWLTRILWGHQIWTFGIVLSWCMDFLCTGPMLHRVYRTCINWAGIVFVFFQACLVHTTETIRVRYFMDKLLEKKRPVMLVGNAGTGKSVLVGEKLSSLDPDEYLIKNVPFNYYTTSAMLQGIAFSFFFLYLLLLVIWCSFETLIVQAKNSCFLHHLCKAKWLPPPCFRGTRPSPLKIGWLKALCPTASARDQGDTNTDKWASALPRLHYLCSWNTLQCCSQPALTLCLSQR